MHGPAIRVIVLYVLTSCHVVWCVLQERYTSSNWQTAFNAINVLCGVGLLTTPYAMAISGTSALLLLVLIGTVLFLLMISSSADLFAAVLVV